jgi:protein tyrosine phosphatase (PTP) superfamily phosphohydrolase (DUF442 family)
VATAVGWWMWGRLDNFHPVIDGKVYRSAQLSSSSLRYYTRTHGIRTIINLRGANRHESWYRNERQVAQECGALVLDVPVNSVLPLDKTEVRSPVEALESSPGPILLHCQSGTNRTGSAAVIAALLLQDRTSIDVAHRQIQCQMDHLPWTREAQSKFEFVHSYRDRPRRRRGGSFAREIPEMALEQPACPACPLSLGVRGRAHDRPGFPSSAAIWPANSAEKVGHVWIRSPTAPSPTA